ncbi:MAG: RNA 2'-phosphotransferase [Promethearchaeia archaeon]
MGKFYVSMSKFLSYMLRHHPEKFNIQLDTHGYADLEKVLKVLNDRYEKRNITKETIEEMIKRSNKKRFEVEEQQIRAYYGHSVDKKIEMQKAENLPNNLYHGTTPKAYKNIQKSGLRKKNRQYVHLSKNLKTGINVGKRRTDTPVILKIKVQEAKDEGIIFYRSGDIYLANYIPPKFLERV